MKVHNICFIGTTGFGKSSLINAVFGAKFNTDPLVSCTKELYSVLVLNDNKAIDCDAFLVTDTPGIGEFSSNSQYQSYYEYAVSQADHIVLVVTLDRIDAKSQDLLDSVRPFLKSSDVKFTIALNRIDSEGVSLGTDASSWDNDKNEPTEIYKEKISKRFMTIHENYDDFFLPFEIIPVCALRNYGIDELKNRIIQ